MAGLTGCGYQLTHGTSAKLSAVQSVWVPFIGNESVSATAQTVIRRKLLEEFHALRSIMPAASEPSAEMIVKGRLLTYSNKAVSYTALDRAREYRLTIDVELEAVRRGDTKPFWKGVLQGSGTYPANVDLALQRNSEEAALAAAASVVAQRLITSLEQSF